MRRRVDTRRNRRAGDDWLAGGVELRQRADRLDRAAEAILAPFGLDYLQFRILRATDALCRRFGDAVSQRQVAEELGIGEMRTSRAMRALAHGRLVNRGPSAAGLAYRVVVTSRGRKTLSECRSLLATSRAALEILRSG